ncbi:MAG: hypothetical protein ACRCXA_02340 [Peptostreptococcaceae bacterium]
MKWTDVKKEYPNKWVLIKAINARTENGLRLVEELEVLNSFENGQEALKEYSIKHKLNKSDEMYVYHSSKDNLEISERVWMGVRKND